MDKSKKKKTINKRKTSKEIREEYRYIKIAQSI